MTVTNDSSYLIVSDPALTKGAPCPLVQAIGAWKQCLGPGHVITSSNTLSKYQASTTGVRRRIHAILKPRCTEEVTAIVRIASKHQISLYIISSGRNWGYGSANPTANDCVIVDLSYMNRIISIDEELGVVTIEPGVTQQDLYSFLLERNLPYMVPTHGGGPDCSLVGNLLERGYGITPHTDHFGALMSLQAVLPDGSKYQSPLEELGGTQVHGLFKWGIGPYIDGLFSQSNLGIVTRATIALVPCPETVEAFFFSVESNDRLAETIDRTRDVISMLGSTVGAINLMNRLRVLSMIVPYPWDQLNSSGVIPDNVVEELGVRNGIACWTGAGTLYGTRRMVAAARREIKKMLGGHVQKLVFVNRRNAKLATVLMRLLPGERGRSLRHQLDSVNNFLNIASGIPNRVALPLAYWRTRSLPRSLQPMNPASDGCGLIWYSPLVPMRGDSVKAYTTMVEKVCRDRSIEPLITLTTLSDRVFDSTVPIVFDGKQESEIEQANSCYAELLRLGKKQGVIPYRVPVGHMQCVTDIDCEFWRTARKIKMAIDPKGILAPGRYCPV